jgi:hypothetical protein
MPSQIQSIPSRTKVLGADATPDFNTLKPLFLLLFQLIFPASKAQVARSNRAGEANIPLTIFSHKQHHGLALSIRLVKSDFL